MDEVQLDRATIRLLPVVRGLPSEAETVRRATDSPRPAAIGISIGPEELIAFGSSDGGPLSAENFEEEIYVAGLSAWERAINPPPCFSEAIKAADARGVPIEAVDMDEVTYTESYVDCVSGLEVVFQGRFEKPLTKKRFPATNPRDFVLEWDAEVDGAPRVAPLPSRPETFIASRLPGDAALP